MWQTWRGYYLRVLSGIHLTLLFLALLQKDLFNGMWGLAEGFFNENYCHACHTRFSAVFPLPSCCISSLMLKVHLHNKKALTQPKIDLLYISLLMFMGLFPKINVQHCWYPYKLAIYLKLFNPFSPVMGAFCYAIQDIRVVHSSDLFSVRLYFNRTCLFSV